MNGTRLNDVVISCEHRRPSDEHPLRHGDVIAFAEDIKVEVALTKPELMPGAEQSWHRHRSHTSLLRVAPRKGLINVQMPLETSRNITARDHQTSIPISYAPNAEQEEYYSSVLDAEFAVLTQV